MTGQILVVENDPKYVRSISDLLGYDGHTVTIAHDGPESLNLFTSGTFDVVIINIGTPKLDGTELIRAMKALDPTVELIVLTRKRLMDEVETLIQNGAYDFVLIPDEISYRLQNMVRHALEKRILGFGFRNPSRPEEIGVTPVDTSISVDTVDPMDNGIMNDLNQLISNIVVNAQHLARKLGRDRALYKRAVQIRKTSHRVAELVKKLEGDWQAYHTNKVDLS